MIPLDDQAAADLTEALRHGLPGVVVRVVRVPRVAFVVPLRV
jgi:hypothetical protein